jgi:alpha-1,2-mannosyltransferase
VTLGYGQIDLLITALVVFDLSRPDTARTKGAAIGIAAAIKLTPLLFLPYLLLSGRRRAATIGTGTFALSIAISYATITQDASRYWQHLVLDISRIGNVADTGNQSLQGAIARLDPVAHPSTAEHLVVAAIAALGLALAVRASRSGNEQAGFSLTALTALLASPISWTHHWTLAMPALLLLCRHAHQQRARLLTMAATALILLGYSYLPEYTEGPLQHAGINTILYADPYTLAASIVLGVAAIRTISAIGNPDRDRRYPRKQHTPNGSRARATG